MEHISQRRPRWSLPSPSVLTNLQNWVVNRTSYRANQHHTPLLSVATWLTDFQAWKNWEIFLKLGMVSMIPNLLLSLSHNFQNFFLPDTFLLSLETSLTSRYSEIQGDLLNINLLLLPGWQQSPRDRNSKSLPTLWSCDPVLTKQTWAEVGLRLLGKIFLLKRKARSNGSACLWVWGVVNRKIHLWKFMEQKNGKSLYLTVMAESLRSPIILLVSDLSLSSYVR